MKINRKIEIRKILDASHYYATMSELDKIKLYNFDNPSSLKIEDHVWYDLWEIVYNKNKVGYINIFKDLLNDKVSIAGIYLLEKYRGKKILQFVAFPLMFYYFNDLTVNKIEACVFNFNLPSLSLCKKYASQEGVRKQTLFYKNEYHDQILFGITRQDFLNSVNK
jgi:RimJ/RimL family protein N-acetyltransferase